MNQLLQVRDMCSDEAGIPEHRASGAISEFW